MFGLKSAAPLAAAALLVGCATMPSSTPAASKDQFLWLEEVEGPKALDWVKAQNARTLAVLEGDPRYAGLYADALKIATNKDRLPLGAIRDGFVYNFWQDADQVRGLWRRASLTSYASGRPVWEPLLDVDALAKAEGKNWVYQGVNCAPGGGRVCLVSLSDGGKDERVQREFDVAKRAFVPGGFEIPSAKSDAAWADANSLFVATNWGEGSLTESGYPFIVKRWKRGEPLSAAVEVLRGGPKDVAVWMGSFTAEDGQRLTVATRAETFFTASQFALTEKGAIPLPLPKKATVRGLHKGEIVFTIEEDWTPAGATAAFEEGSLLSMPLAQIEAQPPVRLIYGPGARESVEDVGVAKDAVLASVFRNVKGMMLRFTFDGKAWVETQVPFPANGAVNIVSASSDASTAFAVYEDFLTPQGLYAIDAARGGVTRTMSLPAQFDASALVSEQFEATSKDGTKVPYFVLRRKDLKLDGAAPTLLYGYGGFQISINPAYASYTGKLWLEQGGVYVSANIRGGGEFGPGWHQAGLKLNRQVVYDDFIAVAEDLIKRGITSPRRLGIHGRSNGGLLMGVMLDQRPELFDAAIVGVPLLDMLRYAEPNMLAGASWVDEYGDPRLGADGKPTHPDERAFLEKLTPYQNLTKRADFPVPFFYTSTKDDRVHPGHARKYAAKMESLGMPFWYYENIDGGHAGAANQKEQAQRRALETIYLMKTLKD